jgi:hypothetical protein
MQVLDNQKIFSRVIFAVQANIAEWGLRLDGEAVP